MPKLAAEYGRATKSICQNVITNAMRVVTPKVGLLSSKERTYYEMR